MSETSWFETGLMSCDSTYQGWKDAKWIGGSDQDMVLYSHYLPVFRLEYTIQLNEILKSTCAGLVYGANDARLMDKIRTCIIWKTGRMNLTSKWNWILLQYP